MFLLVLLSFFIHTRKTCTQFQLHSYNQNFAFLLFSPMKFFIFFAFLSSVGHKCFVFCFVSLLTVFSVIFYPLFFFAVRKKYFLPTHDPLFSFYLLF